VKRGLVLAFAVAVCCIWAGRAIAQERFSIDVKDATFYKLIGDLAEKSGAKVVTDAALDSKITTKLSNVTMEEALDSICKTYNLRWIQAKVALKEGDVVSGSALGRLIRSLSSSELPAVIVEPTEGQEVAAFGKGEKAVAPAVEKVAFKDRSFETVYLVTPKEGAAESDNRVQHAMDVTKEQYKLMFDMTDQEKQAYFDEAMQLYFSLDPKVKAEMMLQSLRMMARMSPAARQQMMQESMQMMQQLPREELEQMFGGMVPPDFGQQQPPPPPDDGNGGGDQ
jgi:hypothetical protein